MQIIEHYIKGKRPNQQLCEDGWVVTPHFAAVIDGSTSKVAGRQGGLLAMQLVREALHTLPATANKRQMLQYLTQTIAQHNVPETSTQAAYRLTCSAVIYSKAHRVVWMVGDCQCRFNGRTYTHGKLVDEVLINARVEAARYLLQHGHSAQSLQQKDLARAMIFDVLREQTNFQNDPNPYNPYRYPVIDGTPIDDALVPEWEVPAEVHELVLASDGYPTLTDTLNETEENLQRLLKEDPLCIGENAATKCLMTGNYSFDDRCYLRIAL